MNSGWQYCSTVHVGNDTEAQELTDARLFVLIVMINLSFECGNKLEAIFFMVSGSASAKRSDTFTSRAFAIRLMLSAEGKRRFISILPIKVVEHPTLAARAIWESPKIRRYFFMFFANRFFLIKKGLLKLKERRH